MSSDLINNEWKKKLLEIDSDDGHHNPYVLLENIKDELNKIYEKEKKYHIKHNIIKNVWYCDSIKDYVYFLEKELRTAIKIIKSNEEGFSLTNKILNKKN